jgi:integrase
MVRLALPSGDSEAINRKGSHATMILMAYWHGLRVSELVDLRWDQIDFDTANLSVRRAKKGSPSTHPVRGDELRSLRRLQREQDPKSAFVFTSETRYVPCDALVENREY